MNVGEGTLFIAVLGDANRVAGGQKGGTGGAADGLGVEISEPDALAGHFVYPRSFEVGGAENAEVAVALVIGEDDDEVRLPSAFFQRRRGAREQTGQQE